jgi:hypothetical protein
VRIGAQTARGQRFIHFGEHRPVPLDLGIAQLVVEGDRRVHIGAENRLAAPIAAQRQPRERVERQLRVLREHQPERAPDDGVDDRGIDRDHPARGQAAEQQIAQHGTDLP